MKHLILSMFFWSMTFGIIAQVEIPDIPKKQFDAGIDLMTKNKIIGTEFIFPKKIYKSRIDSTTQMLTVQLRDTSYDGNRWTNMGEVLRFDLKNTSVTWIKELNYSTYELHQFENLLLQSGNRKCYALDINTGEEKWKVKSNIYFSDYINKIAIGYDPIPILTQTVKNTLKGISLTDGSEIWQREISRQYGWEQIKSIDDSTYLVLGDGLHYLNIKTGEGWDYSKETYTSNGYYHLSSNVSMDSLGFYWASKATIQYIDRNGKTQWIRPLPDKIPGDSRIIQTDSLIYLINWGLASYYQIPYTKFGQPYFACFKKDNGEPHYITLLNKPKTVISDYQFFHDTIYFAYKNKIEKFLLTNGQLIAEKTYKVKSNNCIDGFIGSSTYIQQKDSTFIPLIKTDTTVTFVYTRDNRILVMNQDLNILREQKNDDLYRYYLKTPNYKFLAKGEVTIIIDKDGKKIAEIKATGKSTLLGKTLYSILKNSYISINLSEVLKDDILKE